LEIGVFGNGIGGRLLDECAAKSTMHAVIDGAYVAAPFRRLLHSLLPLNNWKQGIEVQNP
jgi:hypothetical protein